MKILLTGASGFIGQNVLTALQQKGIEIVTIGRNRPNARAEYIQADLLNIVDFTPILQTSQPTHLLHLAWETEHGKYWTSPANLRWIEATSRLVESFCMFGGKQVVIAGTSAEYDWEHGYCREETTPLNPTTLYGTAKDITRRLVIAICEQYQIPCAWGRVFLPFGHGEARNRLIPSLVDVFLGKRVPFSINSLSYRDFLYASDVAAGFMSLLTEGTNGVYNISSGEPVRLAELVTDIAHLLNADPKIILGLTTERNEDNPLLVGENLKLKALGWRPKFTLTEGLERTLHEENNRTLL